MGADAATWHASTLHVIGRPVTVFGRAGLPSGMHPSAASVLLAEEIVKHRADHLLLCDVSVALPALVVPPQTQITTVMRHAGMRQAAEKTLSHAGIAAQVSADGFVPTGTYDIAMIEIAPTREAWRMRLYEAARWLRPGGILIAAGPNDAGGKSAAKDVKALFGSVNEYAKAHQRIVVALKPNEMPVVDDIMCATWMHAQRTYYTYPGVFAADRLDIGSAELIAALPDLTGCCVLDLGGGAGVLTGAALDAGAQMVDVIDVDALAVQSMQRTFAEDSRVRIAWGDVLDGVPWQTAYDVVLTNPPFHAGKRTDDSMVRAFVAEAARHLRPQGQMYLVANAFLAYGPLLQHYFDFVAHVRATKSFVVWHCRL